MAVLGVAGGDRAQLAEALDLADGHRLVAEEMKERIEHHRAMAGGQHEAVAVGPARIGGVEFEEAREQHGGDIGGAHGQPGMARLRRLDRVHRQRPNGIGETVMGRARCGRGGMARNAQELHPCDARDRGEVPPPGAAD